MTSFRIHSAEFLKCCGTVEQFPKSQLPEIAMVGRSNVGKSSAINCLLNRNGLAKVGKIPGKTQTINFYRVETNQGPFELVDLPGYGFAKVPDRIQKQWVPLIEQFFQIRNNLRGVVLLVDVRRVQEQDRRMLQWLEHLHIPYVVVATKADKVARGKQPAAIQDLQENLDIPIPPLLLSAHSGDGKQLVLDEILSLLGTRTSRR
ncbi:MAG: ribosome biogenesis GTP-binding protein YihA/YsxC [Nitrospirales bacterium]|nr:YihA family ribosome biogenesis GTP-binding protein [Nitrospira sp.]MCA9480614.1 YihA family ribosome biogenesis GTP-binding protein [Nitrospira sp.]MDR4488649.1 ribosome biogenesis GTP-binding protein YihA/YsxC [Nitrospirales bacterium]